MGGHARLHLVEDLGLAALVGGLALAEVWVPFDSVAGSGSPALTTVGIILETVLIALRRVRPIAVAGIPAIWILAALMTGGRIQVVFFGQLVALCVAVYSVARHGKRRDIWIVAALAMLLLVLGDVFLPALGSIEEILFHWGAVVAVFGVGLGLRMSEQRAVQAALRAAEAEAASREMALRAITEERTRIARELHDILGHSVSVMVVQAGAAAQAVDDDPAFVRRALESIRSTGTESLDEVRRVVALLREQDDDLGFAPQPGVAQLPELVEQAGEAGLEVELVVEGAPGALLAGQELAVYRIVQEALTNVRKHSAAPAARVVVRHEAAGVEIVVTDTGSRATDASGRRHVAVGAHDKGHGIVGMRERAALYGGTIEVGPDPSGAGGWRVRAWFPAEGAT